MFEIILIGMNHKSAPVELRECVSFEKNEISTVLGMLRKKCDINELILFSTCNRFELLMIASDVSAAINGFKQFIVEFRSINVLEFEKSIYCYIGDDAIRHLFRVVSSLDSMIIGEPQILGQVKEAYKIAITEKTSGVVLNKLLHKAFFVAKKVRTETGIGDNAVSISYAAVELGKKIFGSLRGKRVMLIGAGEMAELAVEHLLQNELNSVFIVNRTFQKSLNLAKKFNGKAISFDEYLEYIKYVDIVISSTGAMDFVIKKDPVKKIMKSRRNQSLFLIDIAVPRDIDPRINDLNNVYVYDIDDLKEIIKTNKEDRIKEALKAERIIEEALIHFRKWYITLDVIPTVVAIRNKFIIIADNELKKTFQTLVDLSNSDKVVLTRMLNVIINKFLHDPTLFLKKRGCRSNKSFYLDFAKKLFNLS